MDHIYTHPSTPTGSVKSHGDWFISSWESLSESQVVDYIHTIKLADRWNKTMAEEYSRALHQMFLKFLG